jgi:hypothetical protein
VTAERQVTKRGHANSPPVLTHGSQLSDYRSHGRPARLAQLVQERRAAINTEVNALDIEKRKTT